MHSYNLVNPMQAYKDFQKAWKDVKVELLAGKRKVLNIVDYDEALTAQQRRYYHGYVLTMVAMQARANGHKLQMTDWKEHYREIMLGDEVKNFIDVKTGAVTKKVKPISTESLGVRGYNKLIEQVTADASAEWGVVFDASFDEWREAQDDQ